MSGDPALAARLEALRARLERQGWSPPVVDAAVRIAALPEGDTGFRREAKLLGVLPTIARTAHQALEMDVKRRRRHDNADPTDAPTTDGTSVEKEAP